MKCWAKLLGNCDTSSREHLVSEGIYPDEVLTVQGLHWCSDAPKDVHIKSLASRILCEKHNNALSPLDKIGINSMNTFREVSRLWRARSDANTPEKRWTKRTFRIDGRGLERWCLKTLINVVCSEGGYRLGADSTEDEMPSDRLVRIPYGRESFKSEAGLYGVGDIDTRWNIIDAFRLILFANVDKKLVEGGLFSIHGFQFMLYLEETGLPERMQIPDLHRGGIQNVKTFYPLQGLNFQIGSTISHRLIFLY